MKYLIAFFLLISMTGCYSSSDGKFVEPVSLYEKVSGEWKIASLRQVDEIAKAASQSPNELVLTNQFEFSTFTIDLKVDNDQNPTTFSIGGDSPQFFAKEGYWQLSRTFPSTSGTPTYVELYSDAQKTNKIGQLTLSSTPSGKKEMDLTFTRKDKGVPFVSYLYKLTENVE